MVTNATWVCWAQDETAIRVSRTESNRIEVEIYDANEATGMFVELGVRQATALSRALLERIEEVQAIAKEQG